MQQSMVALQVMHALTTADLELDRESERLQLEQEDTVVATSSG